MKKITVNLIDLRQNTLKEKGKEFYIDRVKNTTTHQSGTYLSQREADSLCRNVNVDVPIRLPKENERY